MKKLEAYKIEFNENALAKFTLDREKLVSLRKNINTLKKTVKGLESHYNELSKVQLSIILTHSPINSCIFFS